MAYILQNDFWYDIKSEKSLNNYEIMNTKKNYLIMPKVIIKNTLKK